MCVFTVTPYSSTSRKSRKIKAIYRKFLKGGFFLEYPKDTTPLTFDVSSGLFLV